MEAVQLVTLVHYLSKIFKDISEEEHVGQKIVVVVVFHGLYAKARPRILCPLIVLLFQRLVLQIVVETIDGRELCFLEFFRA